MPDDTTKTAVSPQGSKPAAEKQPADYQARLVQEKKDLDEKLSALVAFNGSEKLATLPQEDQKLMVRQEQVMNSYSIVLGQRIARFSK